MKKYDLLRNEETLIRVLAIEPDKVFIIDCIKKTTPEVLTLHSYHSCTDEEVYEFTEFTIIDIDTLDAHQKRTKYECYSLIAPVLPFVADEKNMRWGLNKFFYTTAKQSLTTAYTMMLKEKYCDNMGVLMDTY